jgi:hypothetical protein
MDIDGRIEVLTMNLELLASMHQDFEKEWDARMQDWDNRSRQFENLQLDLTRLLMAHGARLDDHDKPLKDLGAEFDTVSRVLA